MRWILGAFFVVAMAAVASPSQAVVPGAVTASVESARVSGDAVQDVAMRRRHHRHPPRHRMHRR